MDFLMGPNQWHPNLGALSAVCRPVVVDLLGHGRSSAPAQGEHYQPGAYVEAFETIRQALQTERWMLCGYSLGAGTDHGATPYRIRSASSATPSPTPLRPWRTPSRWAPLASGGRGRPAARILTGGRKAIERIPVHPRFAKRIDAASRALVLADAARLRPQGVANAIRCTTPEASVRSELGDNKRPALLLNGARERRLSAAPGIHRPAHAAKCGSPISMPATPSTWKPPPAFNQALAEFIEQCPIS